MLKAWREPQGMAGGEENVSSAVMAEEIANVGAEIMGRGEFGPAAWFVVAGPLPAPVPGVERRLR